MTQKEISCSTVGTTVSGTPRVAPIRTACSPSAMQTMATRESADTSGQVHGRMVRKDVGDGSPG